MVAKEYVQAMVLGRMTLCEVIKPKSLTVSQIKALRELGEPGHYRVNWRPKLTRKQYLGLVNDGYIAEAWTWASVTRPDVSITEKGIEALNETANGQS